MQAFRENRRYKESGGRQRGTKGGFCFKTEGGVLVMPSVLTTSGLDGVLRPVHLEGETSVIKGERQA